MSFGNRLKELRKSKGITQAELAEIVNLSRPSIAAFEGDARLPEINTLESMAEFFGVTVDYLLGRTQDKSYEETVLTGVMEGLQRAIKESGDETKKITVSIMDSLFMALYFKLRREDIEELKKLRLIYRSVYEIQAFLSNRNVRANMIGETDDPHKIVLHYAKIKNELNNHLDDLLLFYGDKDFTSNDEKNSIEDWVPDVYKEK